MADLRGVPLRLPSIAERPKAAAVVASRSVAKKRATAVGEAVLEPETPEKFRVTNSTNVSLTRRKEPYFLTKWIREEGPAALWGTQEMLTPPTETAKRGSASARVAVLASPKHNFQTGDKIGRPEFLHSCGRASTLWLVSDVAKSAEASARVTALAKHKPVPSGFQEQRPQFTYSCGRSSPVWQTSSAAMSAEDRPRTSAMALPKPWPRDYVGEKSIATQIPPTALRAACTPRLDELARPKTRQETQYREALWLVSETSKKAIARGRLAELAKERPMPDGYSFNYDLGNGYERMPMLVRAIPVSARRAIAGARISELAVPLSRETMDKVQFNPEAFNVRPSALKAWCSPRIQELAAPITRG